MTGRRWQQDSPVLRGEMSAWPSDQDERDDRQPHALRVVALCTLGFWAVVATSCAAWVWGV